jgi:aspartate racemase
MREHGGPEMKKPGLIGGIGPESTIQYYRQIIRKYREKLNSDNYPEILIHSADMSSMLELVFTGRLIELAGFMAERVLALEKAGADFAAIASNTPHMVIDEIQERVNIPVISIVEETCKSAGNGRVKKLALFGTKSTMTDGFYNRTAEKYGIEIIIPNDEEIDFINNKYMNELVYNRVLSETKTILIQIAERMKASYGIHGLILGGTELSLVLSQEDFEDIKILDTSSIHVESIVYEMISE